MCAERSNTTGAGTVIEREMGHRSFLRRAPSTWHQVDLWLLRRIKSKGAKSPFWRLMKGLSTIGEHGLVWAGSCGILAVLDRDRRTVWALVASTGPISIVVNFCLKNLVRRRRPEDDSQPSSTRVSFSFPSAHAFSSFAVATAWGRIEPRARKPVLLLASFIAYSRVYLGRHYPSDVLAGGVLGVAVGRAIAAAVPVDRPSSQR
jgi:undecaprenyl-diphosphatase